MKISKQVLMIMPMLFIFFAVGCSKNLIQIQDEESLLAEKSTAEEKVDGLDTSSGQFEKPGPGPDFGSAPQGMPGDGSTGSFSAEPFVEKKDAGPSTGLDEGISSSLYEKPGPGPDFGSAPQGMPGDGSTGSFSAKPFEGDGGVTRSVPKPDSEFFREESVGEFDTASRLYEKPGPGPDFGSAPQGMPGDGSTGSFSAEPFEGDGGKGQLAESAEPFAGNGGNGQPPEPAEPFLPEKKESLAPPLASDEEVRRQLPYQASENLEDIHFAFDKFDLDGKARAILQKNVAYLESHPNARIEIQGHCDERGSNNYNITLGERRALSTKSYLVSHGVDENRIRTISYGEERPFCFESNEKCWYQNRRGHFLVAE